MSYFFATNLHFTKFTLNLHLAFLPDRLYPMIIYNKIRQRVRGTAYKMSFITLKGYNRTSVAIQYSCNYCFLVLSLSILLEYIAIIAFEDLIYELQQGQNHCITSSSLLLFRRPNKWATNTKSHFCERSFQVDEFVVALNVFTVVSQLA